MRKLVLLAGLAVALPASAQTSCWILHDLQGISYRQDDEYIPQRDGFGAPLRIIFDGNNTRTPGSEELRMMQIDEFMAVGVGKSDAFATVETYQVDPTLGIALYTKVLNAKSVFSNMSGAKTFLGRAERCRD